jgi:hypothetical protein
VESIDACLLSDVDATVLEIGLGHAQDIRLSLTSEAREPDGAAHIFARMGLDEIKRPDRPRPRATVFGDELGYGSTGVRVRKFSGNAPIEKRLSNRQQMVRGDWG